MASLLVAAALLCLAADPAPLAPAAGEAKPVRVGSGAHTYEWVHDWM